MNNELEKKVFAWVKAEKNNLLNFQEEYCETRDIFQARLDKMVSSLLAKGKIGQEEKSLIRHLPFWKNKLVLSHLTEYTLVYMAAAIAGEIGNNSFDHNLGSWPDIMGVFFGYELTGQKLKIALSDRGQGLLATLKGVKPELENDSQALFTAFNERISGRAPESRGNGLKFVKENIKNKKMNLLFISGRARAELNDKMTIKETDDIIRGSLAIISYQYAP